VGGGGSFALNFLVLEEESSHLLMGEERKTILDLISFVMEGWKKGQPNVPATHFSCFVFASVSVI